MTTKKKNNSILLTTKTTTTTTTTMMTRTTYYVDIHKHINYNDILDMVIDSKEEVRSIFPKNQNSSKLRVKWGDQRPDLSKLSEKEAEEVFDIWRKKRKAFTDKVNRTTVREDHEMKKFEFDSHEETLWDHSTQLCAMAVVKASRLSAGHVFQLKDSLCCREGDDLLTILMNCMNISEKKLRTPLQLKRIAPIITNAVEETPGISYQMSREILSPFANDYTLTDNILHDGRDILFSKLWRCA